MISTIQLEHNIKQMEGNIVCDVDGEKAMLSLETLKYYNLGDIGGDIWQLLEHKISVRQVIDTLMSEYEVDQWECEVKVVSFLERLVEEKLIQIVDR